MDHNITAVGIDLGELYSHLCELGRDGSKRTERRIRTHPKAFREAFSDLQKTQLVIEAGTHSRWVSALLEELGHEVWHRFAKCETSAFHKRADLRVTLEIALGPLVAIIKETTGAIERFDKSVDKSIERTAEACGQAKLSAITIGRHSLHVHI